MMKNVLLCTLALIVASCAGCAPHQSRDIAYEHYCDSIWENNPDYYVDVLAETGQYQEYIAQHGTWWPED